MGKATGTASPRGRDGDRGSAAVRKVYAPPPRWGWHLGLLLRVTAMGKVTETAAAQGCDGKGEGDRGSAIGKPPGSVAPRSWRWRQRRRGSRGATRPRSRRQWQRTAISNSDWCARPLAPSPAPNRVEAAKRWTMWEMMTAHLIQNQDNVKRGKMTSFHWYLGMNVHSGSGCYGDRATKH